MGIFLSNSVITRAHQGHRLFRTFAMLMPQSHYTALLQQEKGNMENFTPRYCFV
jgi:hypothetical protein